MRIAVIGAGVSGLTAAWHLAREHRVVLFEKDDRPGGHSHTVPVTEDGRELGLDTGFLVYNERTYPQFTDMLARLGVATHESEMSFSVRCDRCSVEYCGSSLSGLFARRRQLLSPRFHRMLAEILRFNREARRVLRSEPSGWVTLGAFLRERRFSTELVYHYLLPMGGAIWSTPPGRFGEIPLRFFLRFFANHGLLALTGHPRWRTVTDGSRRYVEAILRDFDGELRLATPVEQVVRREGRSIVRAAGREESFDAVVLAGHSDDARGLVPGAPAPVRQALTDVPYQPNEAILHTDEQVLPQRRSAWASWNVHVEDCRDPRAPLTMSYLLNRLQRLDASRSYVVTLNDGKTIRPERVLARIPYRHPGYTVHSVDAQGRLRERNGAGDLWFCGAWLYNGFHEDGVRSALDVVQGLREKRAVA